MSHRIFVITLVFALAFAAFAVQAEAQEPTPDQRLVQAIKNQDLDAVEYWLEKGARFSSQCLIESVRTGNRQLTERALAAGVDIDSRGEIPPGWYINFKCPADTALAIAACRHDGELVSFLIGKGAKATSLNNGKTMLQMAYLGDLDLQLTIQNEEHYAPLFDTISRIIAGGASIDIQDQDGRTLLMDAAYYGDEVMVDFLLLSKNAKRELRDASGRTAEDYAANAGHIPLARKLRPSAPALSSPLIQELEYHTKAVPTDMMITHHPSRLPNPATPADA
jgi:ankyrin repeat protein